MPSVCIYQRFLPPDPSGAGKQALAIAQIVREADWKVTFLSDRSNGGGPRSLDGFGVRGVAPPPNEPSNFQIARYWGRVGRALVSMRRDFDVLHVNAADFQHLGAAPWGRLLQKGVVVRSSMAGEFADLRGSRSGRVQKRLLRSADAVVVLSQRLAAEYLETGLPATRLNLIPNGVDTSIYHPVPSARKRALRMELGLPAESRILMFHGVFIERKSLHWLVDVLGPRLDALNLTLLLVGGPAREEAATRYAARLREQIRQSPAGGRIIVKDYDPDVHRYLQAADLYVLASTNEGLANAMLEAMAVGLIPIVTRASGSEDVVQDRRSGFLFEPGDARSLLECLGAALGHSSAVVPAAISNAAVQRVHEQYSIRATAKRYLDVYANVIGKR